jgi:NADPH:quinone reductase-like Zn-dependent oxidoreductase
MKAILFEQCGLPEDVLQIKELPIPEPGPGEVRIKVKAANINPSDIMFIRGMYGITPKLPSSAGFEASGTIDKVGEGVSLPVGMDVIFSNIGVWQEYVICKARGVIPKPAELSYEVACQAFVNPFTAYGLLKESGLKAGDFLLLTAGASAFSKLVIQLAVERGIKVICTVRRDDQIAPLMEMGVSQVVNTEKEKLPKAILPITEGKGVQAAFDAVGGTLGARALASLANGGTMYVYGLLSLENLPLNSGLLIFKNLTVKGFWLSTWFESLSKEESKLAFKEVLGGLASQKLAVAIEAVYDFADFKQAIAHYEKGGRQGKIILKFA